MVGLPVHADGTPHEMTARAERFARQLEGRFGLQVARVDERYTTEGAESALAAAGVRVRDRKAVRDERRRTADPAILVRRSRAERHRWPCLTPRRHSPRSPSACAAPLPSTRSSSASIRAAPGSPNASRKSIAGDHALGFIDVSFYRDDFSRKGLKPEVKRTELPFEVEGATIVLIDDVLYTGRSVRAAINELFDYGRPARVELAVLVDRGGRELPIEATYVGARLAVARHLSIVLSRGADGQLALGTEASGA